MNTVKRAIIGVFIAAALLLACVSCSLHDATAGISSDSSDTLVPQFSENTRSYPAAGYSLEFPEIFIEYSSEGIFSTSETKNGEEANATPYFHKLYADFMPFESLELINEMEQKKDELTNTQKTDYLTRIYSSLKNVFTITAYEKEKISALLDAGTDISQITGFENNQRIGEQEDLVYYLSYHTKDSDGLEKLSAQAYDKLYDAIPDVLQSILYFKPES